MSVIYKDEIVIDNGKVIFKEFSKNNINNESILNNEKIFLDKLFAG